MGLGLGQIWFRKSKKLSSATCDSIGVGTKSSDPHVSFWSRGFVREYAPAFTVWDHVPNLCRVWDAVCVRKLGHAPLLRILQQQSPMNFSNQRPSMDLLYVEDHKL
ncbi:unnamed protein product [Ilex paraguariensis]|uniref:Uncharacterized protein n=1 Tax=Ilex paraguariensis TaxID=185542 RepID=A0ABC8UH03_9AQUA